MDGIFAPPCMAKGLKSPKFSNRHRLRLPPPPVVTGGHTQFVPVQRGLPRGVLVSLHKYSKFLCVNISAYRTKRT